jgi:enoyl-CoA hydratase
MWEETRQDAIATATYNAPPMNYHTDAALEQLDGLIDGWATSDDVRVIILTGGVAGRFITHFDVDQILANQEQPDTIFEAPARSRRSQSVLRRLNHLSQPVIAALNGDAMGAGFELALASDVRIAQRGDFRLGLPEVRLGLTPAGSGLTRMTKLVGVAKAFELIVGAKVLTPEEALEAGLVAALADDALAAARELASSYAAMTPIVVAMAKKAIYQVDDVPLDLALTLEVESSFRLKQSPDIQIPMREYLSQPLERRRDWLDPDR